MELRYDTVHLLKTFERLYQTIYVRFVICTLFLTADAGRLYLMWLQLKQQERPVSGGFIFITRWNSLGHVRRVMDSMVSIHEVFCFHRIEDGVPCSQGK